MSPFDESWIWNALPLKLRYMYYCKLWNTLQACHIQVYIVSSMIGKPLIKDPNAACTYTFFFCLFCDNLQLCNKISSPPSFHFCDNQSCITNAQSNFAADGCTIYGKTGLIVSISTCFQNFCICFARLFGFVLLFILKIGARAATVSDLVCLLP